MFIAILTLLSALSISGVAIFYSVIGLATIFPGAFWPVVIMGSVLEVGKLVTASWLYRNWKHTRWLLKTYLTTAVIVLICITSMGIFGFLSKAHLEQNLAEDTVTQRIEIINSKILSEETYIKRQKDTIVRLESTLDRTTTSNTGALDIEIQSLKDAEDKFKTLLAVETNTVKDLNDRLNTTVKDLNDRLRVLDKNVSDVLTSNKSFFNEEKAAAELKASQKEEREEIAKKIAEAQETITIKIAEAQERIQILKDDYAKDTEKLQARIDSLRKSNVADNSGVNNDIVKAEQNILDAQNRIDGYIVEREPLQSSMLKLEAEVGPVKYIAALAVDFGITDKVDTSEAVRWVILIIICVFDPLAVLLLIAANQSFLRRFPVKAPKPQEVIDLEKPDDEDITLKWNDAMNKQNAAERMEEATDQLREWKTKLESFNQRVEKPEDKPVEIIQEDNDVIPHIDLKGQKKTEDKEIVADNTKDGFDPDEVMFDLDPLPVDKEKQLEEFKRREQEEKENLERIAEKARKEYEDHDIEGFRPGKVIKNKTTVEEALKMPEAESVHTPIQERIKPDLTEVIEPEKEVSPPKPALSNWQRAELLDNFHKEHGNFEDVAEYVQNEEQNENTAWKKIKTKTTTEEDYHHRMEQRIEDLMAKVDSGEIKLEDLTPEDRQVIIEIRNQNEV
jgi:hypothetical protein